MPAQLIQPAQPAHPAQPLQPAAALPPAHVLPGDLPAGGTTAAGVAAEPSAAHAAALAAILARHGTGQDQLLPALHALQDKLGYVPPGLVPAIAQHFNLSRAEVHGVITFYHHFRGTPPARCVVQVCRAEACQSMGGARLLAHAEQALGCALHGHGADGAYALEPVYCLGLCASAPAITIDGAVFARVTPARFDALLAEAAQGATPAQEVA